MDWPHACRQILSSRRGLFEGLRTDAAGVTVAPGPIVEHFNVIEDIRPGQIPVFVYSLTNALFFQWTEEQFGHRIILAVATLVHARCQVIGPQKRCQSSLPYWLPWDVNRANNNHNIYLRLWVSIMAYWRWVETIDIKSIDIVFQNRYGSGISIWCPNSELFIIPIAGIGAGGMPVGRSHASRNKIITDCTIT